jgi:hypothetical protein
MAKCEEGYLCTVCGQDVEGVTESELYLHFVLGEVDPETLHTKQEAHIRCNPALAQFIVHDSFESVVVDGDFDKRLMDADFVRDREQLLTRGWLRLQEVAKSGLPIIDYPLPEFRDRWR